MAKKFDFEKAYKEQKSAGVDIVNPMNNLITDEPAKKPKKKQESLSIKAVERRTKRVQVVMTPQLYEQVKKEADRIGISFNELINQLCMNLKKE